MTELEYYRMRLAREDERARRTIGTEAELVHRSLAAHYARKAIESLSSTAVNDGGAMLSQSA